MSDPRRRIATITAWMALFALWTAATWALEGRIRTLLRPGAVGDRLLYVGVANLLVGVGGAALLRRRVGAAAPPVSARRRTASLLAGLGLGLGLYFGQQPPSTAPWVVLNGFAQVLTVTVAEVAVCFWALRGVLDGSLPERPRLAAVLTVLIGAPAFGLYHFAHSPPFDTWPMVGLLTGVGAVSGLFFVVSRDVYGTVVFHNFAGTYGVVRSLAAAGALGGYRAPLPPVLITGAVALGLLIAAERLDRSPPH
jgi:hypothetical protein